MNENFPLKPITKGLGYYNRSQPENEVTRPDEMPSFSLDEKNAWAGDVDFGKDQPIDDGVVSPLKDIRENLPWEPVPFSERLRHSGHDGLVKKNLKSVNVSFVAVILDFVFMVSLFFVGLMFLLMFFDFRAEDFFSLIQTDTAFQMANAFWAFGVMFFYLFFSRLIWGKTLGEWTSHQQVGTRKQQLNPLYPLRLFFHCLIALITGYFVVHLLSVLIGRDLLSKISGLSLYPDNL